MREEVYTANCTRASEQGPHGGQWDNTELIVETLELRTELARLLGFDNYAQLSLATKMADDTDSVLAFLHQLARQSRPQAQAEWDEVAAFARHAGGPSSLESWDVSYYSEKLRQRRYQVSQEDIRPYLPVTRVLPGLFEVIRRLYGIEVREVARFDSYHPDVKLYELLRGDTVIARFFLDLYARSHKRGGAWMDTCRVRRQTRAGLQIPVAYLVCNFTPPVGDEPALLTHNELTTLFHEFGHGLHHMLTQQTVAAVSGINGVAWDAVELPSQFLENWCWEREALSFISGHHETGEPLPSALLDRMLAARNFQSGMAMVRQLEFSLFDFRLHREWGSGTFSSVQGLLDEVRREVAVARPPAFNRFQNSFSHIFAYGYAAGYCSQARASAVGGRLLPLRGGSASSTPRPARTSGRKSWKRAFEGADGPCSSSSGAASRALEPCCGTAALPVHSRRCPATCRPRAAQRRADDGRYPEQPQLGNRHAFEQRHAGAARR
ncbi:MAG: M3 family metallopeptidase [Halioglobus sp.]